MKFEMTIEKLEEMVCCIVDCGLNRDDACEYAKEFALEGEVEDAEIND